ncbi:MAG: Mrp/NBP35 family ATP-binding protein, partial [Chloroflexota bacterium]|nr:Mrp/NBP35 family ATP-binding protein [Chloroflexota bacterium]
MAAPTKEQIIEAIRPVQDPDLQQSLVELNMIKDVEVQDNQATVHVELATPADPLRPMIETDLRQAVLGVEGVEDVRVSFSSRVRPSSGGLPDKNPISGVKNTIAVASGKGGVGKSTVAVNLAVALAQDGARVGLLDADVYGPSIPLMMGTAARPTMRDNKIVPLEAFGVKIMSIGFLLDADRALIWRGPLVAQLINQFLNEVNWGELDYLVVDLPPGTGDVQLTLVQKIPLSGAIIVTTPQDVALADAIKGIQMFREVKTPILGIVENMSYFACPHCGERSEIFG